MVYYPYINKTGAETAEEKTSAVKPTPKVEQAEVKAEKEPAKPTKTAKRK